jgi:hypothetical protein
MGCKTPILILSIGRALGALCPSSRNSFFHHSKLVGFRVLYPSIGRLGANGKTANGVVPASFYPTYEPERISIIISIIIIITQSF